MALLGYGLGGSVRSELPRAKTGGFMSHVTWDCETARKRWIIGHGVSFHFDTHCCEGV